MNSNPRNTMKLLASISLVTAAIFTLSLSNIQAQDQVIIKTTPDKKERKSRSLSFGMQIAPTFAWLKSDNKGYDNQGSAIGFNYGLVTDFSLSDNSNYFFSTGVQVAELPGKMLSPSIHYDPDTTALGNTLEYATEDYKYKLRYIDIPLGLKMKTAEIGYIKYFGQFGVTPGFLIRAKKTGDFTYQSGVESIVEEDASEEIASIRLGLSVGAGIEYNLTGNTNAVVSIIYNNGLTNVLKGQAGAGKAFETDQLGNTDLSNVGTPESGATIGTNGTLIQGPKLVSRNNYVAVNLAIFF